MDMVEYTRIYILVGVVYLLIALLITNLFYELHEKGDKDLNLLRTPIWALRFVFALMTVMYFIGIKYNMIINEGYFSTYILLIITPAIIAIEYKYHNLTHQKQNI